MAKRKPLVFVAGEIVEQKAGDTLEGNNIVVTASGSTEERPLKDRFADIVNVKDFGAKGDGETDDTLAFEKAVAEAARKGGVVYVPHGTYKVAEPVTGEFISFGHPTIVGEGSVTFLTDLYDDYVHKTKNVKEDITGDKTFVGKTDFKNDVVFSDDSEFKKIPVSVTPDTNDNSKKVPTTEWIHNLISGSEGLSFDPETGQLRVDFKDTPPETKETIIREIIHEGGGIDTDPDDGTIIINLTEMPTETKQALLTDLIEGGDNDGFEINSDGKLRVKPAEIIVANGGLATGTNGKLQVQDGNASQKGKVKLSDTPDASGTAASGTGLSAKAGKDLQDAITNVANSIPSLSGYPTTDQMNAAIAAATSGSGGSSSGIASMVHVFQITSGDNPTTGNIKFPSSGTWKCWPVATDTTPAVWTTVTADSSGNVAASNFVTSTSGTLTYQAWIAFKA